MAERKRPGDAGDPADDEVFDDAVAGDEVSDDNLEDEPVGRGGGTAVRERTKGADQPKAKEKSRRGLFGRVGGFFREVVSELRKVIWPTRKELLTYTTIVIIFVVVMTSVVSGLDFAFGKAILWAFGG